MQYTFRDEIENILISKNNEFINVDFSDFKNFVCFGSALMRVNESYLKCINDYPAFNVGSSVTSVVSATATIETVQKLASFYENMDDYGMGMFNTVFNSLTAYTIHTLSITGAGVDSTLSGCLYNVPIIYRNSNNELISSEQLAYMVNLSISASNYDRDNANILTKHFGDYFSSDTNLDFRKLLYIIGRFFDQQRLKIQKASFVYNQDWLEFEHPDYSQLLNLFSNMGIKGFFGKNNYPQLFNFVDGYGVNGNNSFVAGYEKYLLHRFISNCSGLLKSKGTYESIYSILKLFGVDCSLIDIYEFVRNESNDI